MIKTILYIHQSSELYGSDKALYYLVKEISKNSKYNVIVILPNDGPLKKLLESHGIKVFLSPVIKVSRELFTLKKIAFLPFQIISATNTLNKILASTRIDIVHSNTLAVLLGAFYAKRFRIKHVWHIHEIIKKPRIVRIFYPFLVDNFSNVAVFNSKASRDFLCNNRKSLKKKSIVNLNGMERDWPLTDEATIAQLREDVFNVKKRDIVMGLVGRISKWKGQHLLLEAFQKLKPEFSELKLIFVGSAPPNQEYLLKELQEKINEFSLENDCKIIPFQNNIWSIWDSLDFAVIPSTEPEPFGLVAVEAMLANKAVIASNHGGLVEIVKNDYTGYFFEPKNLIDLQKSIKKLITNKEKLNEFGMNGYKRASKVFSLERHVSKFLTIYNEV